MAKIDSTPQHIADKKRVMKALVHNKAILGVQALRQTKAPVVKLESTREGVLQISGRIRYPLCHRQPRAHGKPYPKALEGFKDTIELHATRTLRAVTSGRIDFAPSKHPSPVFVLYQTPSYPDVSDMFLTSNPSLTSARGNPNRDDVLMMSIGRLLFGILNEMDDVTDGIVKPRLYLYSAHDTTLAPLVEAMGIPLLKWPPFGHLCVYYKGAALAVSHRPPDPVQHIQTESVTVRSQSQRVSANVQICSSGFSNLMPSVPGSPTPTLLPTHLISEGPKKGSFPILNAGQG
ncbi:lysophosphatidic acid phosphatase type 6-like [Plakobranchus ocellatus]|uniref:Lysophosphatidic acid phosphatase type 6-like n=1 Tax=Plakobranchus ocellatus TaxID=259542 RepID=A0AAV3Z2D2_9GAST|nr:lysophosphatidic acid phosphatase type 6-like [Plakobranchus ocellatus]